MKGLSGPFFEGGEPRLVRTKKSLNLNRVNVRNL